MASSSKTRARKRHRLFDEQKGRCHWCGVECKRTAKKSDPTLATLEHVYPNPVRPVLSPKVMACRKCNSTRGAVWSAVLTLTGRLGLVALRIGE